MPVCLCACVCTEHQHLVFFLIEYFLKILFTVMCNVCICMLQVGKQNSFLSMYHLMATFLWSLSHTGLTLQ